MQHNTREYQTQNVKGYSSLGISGLCYWEYTSFGEARVKKISIETFWADIQNQWYIDKCGILVEGQIKIISRAILQIQTMGQFEKMIVNEALAPIDN